MAGPGVLRCRYQSRAADPASRLGPHLLELLHTDPVVGLLHAAQSLDTLPALTDNHGYTPLHWACYNGNTHTHTLLLISTAKSDVVISLLVACRK